MDYQNGNFPLGLAVSDLMNDTIRTDGRPMTEAEKEKMIFKYKDSEKESERERIRAAADADMKSLLQGPGIG